MKNIIQEFLDRPLEEASTSTVRVTKNIKRNQLGGRTAIRMAEQRKDPLYMRYHKFRKLTLELKQKLMAKYGTRGLAAARKQMH